jgi:glutaredoxin-like protein
MALLADDDTQYLRDSFANLAADVTVTVVTRQRSALVMPGADAAAPEDASAEVKQIVDEVAATARRVKVEHVDVVADSERADALAGGRVPAIVFSSPTSKGRLRYYGLPAGYEMSTLIAALTDLGSGESMVPAEIAAELGKLERDVHIQVFVTPSCPHCPAMARAAFQLAMASARITADVVEVQEFPDVARRYEIRGVPMTVVNDGEPLMGNVGGARLYAAVRAAAGLPAVTPPAAGG